MSTTEWQLLRQYFACVPSVVRWVLEVCHTRDSLSVTCLDRIVFKTLENRSVEDAARCLSELIAEVARAHPEDARRMLEAQGDPDVQTWVSSFSDFWTFRNQIHHHLASSTQIEKMGRFLTTLQQRFAIDVEESGRGDRQILPTCESLIENFPEGLGQRLRVLQRALRGDVDADVSRPAIRLDETVLVEGPPVTCVLVGSAWSVRIEHARHLGRRWYGETSSYVFELESHPFPSSGRNLLAWLEHAFGIERSDQFSIERRINSLAAASWVSGAPIIIDGCHFLEGPQLCRDVAAAEVIRRLAGRRPVILTSEREARWMKLRWPVAACTPDPAYRVAPADHLRYWTSRLDRHPLPPTVARLVLEVARAEVEGRPADLPSLARTTGMFSPVIHGMLAEAGGLIAWTLSGGVPHYAISAPGVAEALVGQHSDRGRTPA